MAPIESHIFISSVPVNIIAVLNLISKFVVCAIFTSGHSWPGKKKPNPVIIDNEGHSANTELLYFGPHFTLNVFVTVYDI